MKGVYTKSEKVLIKQIIRKSCTVKYRISVRTQLLTSPRRRKRDTTRDTLGIIRVVQAWHANDVHVLGHQSSEVT